jgi:hypothetical protein
MSATLHPSAPLGLVLVSESGGTTTSGFWEKGDNQVTLCRFDCQKSDLP